MKAYLEFATLCDTNDSNKSDEILLQDPVSLSEKSRSQKDMWINDRVECVRISHFSEARRLGPQEDSCVESDMRSCVNYLFEVICISFIDKQSLRV